MQRMALDAARARHRARRLSKNNDDVARAPFREHPEMLLKDDHIAVFQANWNDKATNIQAIAEELSLGLDSLVFLDDNPVERGLVRQMLPAGRRAGAAGRSGLYARTLAAAGYFEAVAFSDEDRKRAELVPGQRQAGRAAEAGRRRRRLPGVARHGHHVPAVRRDRPGAHRAADQQVQPVQPDHPALHRSRGRRGGRRSERVSRCRSASSDTFGDNGMISVVICRPAAAQTWESTPG